MTSNTDSLEELIEEAVLLLAKAHDSSSSTDSEALRHWRQQSPRHEMAYEQARQDWDLFAQLQNAPLSPREKLSLNVQSVLANAADYPHRFGAIAGIVAIIAMVIAVFNGPDVPKSRFAGTEASTLSETPWDSASVHYETGWQEQRALTLSDGSELWLNWNTQVRVYDGPNDIRVDVLIGDVLFALSKNRKRPFVVRAGQALVSAEDTEFAIHSHGTQDAFFQIRRGAITIANEARDTLTQLKAAEQSYYALGVSSGVSRANLDAIAAWREGKLVFDERPLREILRELSHFTSQPLVVGDIANSNPLITQTYRLVDADEAVLLLVDNYGLELVANAAGGSVVQSIGGGEL